MNTTPVTSSVTRKLAVNTLRTLSIDAVEKAGSGHPGMPMGAAPMAYALWAGDMKHNPRNPGWFNRDRFVLSAGHGSSLLYSLLHLFGYGLTIEDLQSFRQWGSRTPGHPEFGHTPGVDATTGPLGQGIAMAAGMAMAERHLAAVYNKDQFPLVDHYTYCICGDGDLMEGVSAEAASLAGHLGLGRLIVLYDSNDISLDGELTMSFSESVEDRFKAYGWQVLRVTDGNSVEDIQAAIAAGRANEEQPTLIEVKTVIGYGSPNKGGTSACHGAPLGAEEARAVKAAYEWVHEPFEVPAAVKALFAELAMHGEQAEMEWNELRREYELQFPQLAVRFHAAVSGETAPDWQEHLPQFTPGQSLATRESSGRVLNAAAQVIPQLIGGSADLASSNKTLLKDSGNYSRGAYAGRNLWFGVREFAMGAAMNGMALHGGVKVFGATFFVFSDYLRPAIRLAALMKLPVTYVFTHDSVAVGEDGPTHEPIEQLASLRAMPGLSVIRPADAKETAAAWRLALESKDTPTGLILSRQNLPTLAIEDHAAYEGVKRGAYIVSPAAEDAEGLLLATGSEVSLAIAAQALLAVDGVYVSVVSMPSWDRFEQQPPEYRESVLPAVLKVRLAVELGSPFGWREYTGEAGQTLTLSGFGASAPAEVLFREYGFTPENVALQFKRLAAQNGKVGV
ncbi:transketolase [Paenibacillus sp. LMG 31459]|uniref:Transketolase n=1 Tax=Paenibacillus phytohabitans TaxID=2654978 RepID=A0ABX1YSS8_9BACL|nr:transketolase [Paenibacillus phytohabitans]NOU83319.1 transketolase [Paenibacillus phytohabitans]